jgi:prepilin-type N-terminal cleavage/methylation domain-containing protein
MNSVERRLFPDSALHPFAISVPTHLCGSFRPRRAFTLIESIATIVILAVVGSMASFILFTASDGHLHAAVAGQLHSEASMAMDRIVRELRATPADSAAPLPAADIQSITPTSIAWAGGSSLALAGSELIYTNGDGSAVLVGDVAAFNIQAFDESNQAMAATLSGDACQDVRRLRITLTLERHGVSHALRTRIFLRTTMQ